MQKAFGRVRTEFQCGVQEKHGFERGLEEWEEFWSLRYGGPNQKLRTGGAKIWSEDGRECPEMVNLVVCQKQEFIERDKIKDWAGRISGNLDCHPKNPGF